MLNWVNRFSIFCFLDNQQYNFSTRAFECLAAAGCKKRISAAAGDAFEQLRSFYATEKDEWLFGHLAYDLKNETENLQSKHVDRIGFSDLHFFTPEWVIKLDEEEVRIYGEGDLEGIYREILACSSQITEGNPEKVEVKSRISKNEYLHIIENLRKHILRGDCYEINFCQEFFVQHASIDPLIVYHRLNRMSANPFSGLYRVNESYCLCASPERFLKKTGQRIFSQPIKGTSKRYDTDAIADEGAKNYLLQSEKEKSENVMVVDLVRNDLSRICKPGTVIVDELFGIYSFPQVHQMISTVSGEVKDSMNWIDCVQAMFPMGSMTGAPKKRVMELVEQYEQSRRGLFSGAIGYIDPNGNFDFNVVIRSIFYNTAEKYLSFQTGGGITYYSKAEDEYHESLLKAEAMMQALQ